MSHAKRDTTRGAAALFRSLHYNLYYLLYSLSLQSVQGRTPACGNRMFPPRRKGGVGGIPIRLPIFRYALLWCAAHSVTHLMCAPSFAPLRVSSLIRTLRARYAREKSLPAIFSRLAYRKIYCAPPHSRVHAQQILRIPATGCPAALAVADALRTLSLAYSPPCCVALRRSVAHILNVLLTPSRLARLA